MVSISPPLLVSASVPLFIAEMSKHSSDNRGGEILTNHTRGYGKEVLHILLILGMVGDSWG